MNKLRTLVMGKEGGSKSGEEMKLEFEFDSDKLLNITYHYEHLKEVLEFLLKQSHEQKINFNQFKSLVAGKIGDIEKMKLDNKKRDNDIAELKKLTKELEQ